MMRKKTTAILALLVLLLALRAPVGAVEGLDRNRLGTLTIAMVFDGEALEGGRLTAHRVGQIAPNSERFILVDELASSGISLEDLHDPALPGQLYDLALQYNLDTWTNPIVTGEAVFTDLQTGLYVISQQSSDASPGYAPIDPFLLSLPQWQEDGYVYDLTATPKVPLIPVHTEPTAPTDPTEPTEPGDLPQTGQLNWPIPLMAVGGLSFFVLGCVLLSGTKRRHP